MKGPVAVTAGRRAVVAGGGPVGAVAAIMLAQQGWTVQVLQCYSVSLPVLEKYT